jgi:hypothetical protein
MENILDKLDNLFYNCLMVTLPFPIYDLPLQKIIRFYHSL